MPGTVDPMEFDDVATAVLSLVSFDALCVAADGAPVMVTITGGAEHRLVWRSQMAIDLYGERPVGRPVAELFPESSDAMGLWDRAFGGEQVVVPRTVVGPIDVGGRHRVLALSLGPITGADGHVVGVLQFATDITAQVDAEARAARSQLMTAITAAQACADDADAALQAVVDRLVPEIADLAVVYVVADGDFGDHGLARRVAVAGVPALDEAGPLPPLVAPGSAPRWDALLGAGAPVAVGAEGLSQLDVPAPTHAWLERAGAGSLAIAPLVVAGQVTGATVALGTGARPPISRPTSTSSVRWQHGRRPPSPRSAPATATASPSGGSKARCCPPRRHRSPVLPSPPGTWPAASTTTSVATGGPWSTLATETSASASATSPATASGRLP